MIYFDHNASTPVHPVAKESWNQAVDLFYGNPSSPHRIGSRADIALNEARESVAAHLGCSPLDIIWTSGATESNNMVLHHYRKILPEDQEVWISAIEHPCVMEAAQYYFPNRQRLIPVSTDGVIELGWIEENLKTKQPGLISVMAANNEMGALQPWRRIQELCAAHQIPYFTDAAQWIGKLPSRGLGDCDFVSGCAHKFGGLKGIGFLKCPGEGKVHSLMHGGKQAEGRRGGTENLPSAISMARLLDHREEECKQGKLETLIGLQSEFEERVKIALPDVRVLGEGAERLWNTVALRMPDRDCRARWIVKLDRAGFAVSTGSACSSGSETPSLVLLAMGLTPEETSQVVRISGGWETSAADWKSLLRALIQVHKELLQPS